MMTNRSGHPFEFGDVESVSVTPRALTRADSGKIFVTAVADLVLTLPNVTADLKGVTYALYVETLSTGTGAAFSPGTTDKIKGKGITAADNKDLINTAATDAEGDMAQVTCDGTDWIISAGLVGTWARES
jgi:membrane protein implicated in regulation of membrane protease activity